MGVRQSQYIIYGYQCPFKVYSEFQEQWEKENPDKDWYDDYTEFGFFTKNQKNKIGFLSDGMNGEYCIIGICLRFGNGESEFLGIFDTKDFPEQRERLNNQLNLFILNNGFDSLVQGQEPRLIFVDHYS